jgi:hypothetical protein
MAEFDTITMIVTLLILTVISMVLLPYQLRLQARMGIGQLRKSVKELEGWARESRQISLKAITKHGKTKRDIEAEFDEFLEFFAIEPVSADPAGVINRLEHILDVRQRRFKGAVKRFAPNADEESAANIEMAIEGAMANNILYRLMRHYMVLAEKTKNIQLTMLIQLNIPFIREMAKSFVGATKAFAEGKPIGDGVGALTAVYVAGEAKWKEPIEETVYTEVKREGRNILVVKAKGPGGRVGKPGELVRYLARRRKVSMIIMIDAAGKLEGETSGQVIEGVGAAIGGPPTEKYKIEEIATKQGIPVDAILIKESFAEAVKHMHLNLAKGSKTAAERVKQAILNHTKPGDTVIVAGIGNTIGIGQKVKDIPEEFPVQPEKEKDAVESSVLPFR